MSKLELKNCQAQLWFKAEAEKENELLDLFKEIIEREIGLHVHIEPLQTEDEDTD